MKIRIKIILISIASICFALLVGNILLWIFNSSEWIVDGSAESPNGIYQAEFGFVKYKWKPLFKEQTFYEIEVLKAKNRKSSMILYERQFRLHEVVDDISLKQPHEIVEWDLDSKAVTFYVVKEPVRIDLRQYDR